MRRTQTILMALLLVFPTGAQQTPQVPCTPPPTGIDRAMPMNQPDRFAWELFVEVNQKAPAQFQHTITAGGKTFMTNSAVWETWPDDPYTFPADPDPANPPKWPDAPLAKRLLPKGKGDQHMRTTALRSGDFILDTGGEEVHRNRATFESVIKNNLWYTQGIAALVAAGAPAVFPSDSIEVKGNWIPIKEADKSKYHWNYDEKGNLYGLVAMHVTSKAIPNWIWATFENIYNAGRCDYIGCSDCFGTTPSFVPSNQCPQQGNCAASLVGQVYPGGAITSGLQSLYAKAGYTGDWLAQYQNYRLKGSQTDFTTPTGKPILLGNSVTESSFLQTASCMTCHSRAAVTTAGENALPFFGEAQPLPLQNATPAQFQTQDTTYNGTPDPNWYTTYTSNGPIKLYTQMDFVWAIPFQASPAKTTTTPKK